MLRSSNVKRSLSANSAFILLMGFLAAVDLMRAAMVLGHTERSLKSAFLCDYKSVEQNRRESILITGLLMGN